MTKYLIKGTFEIEFDDDADSDWYYCRGVYEDFETFVKYKSDLFFFIKDYFTRFNNHVINVESIWRQSK